jgi:hypothetical protein
MMEVFHSLLIHTTGIEDMYVISRNEVELFKDFYVSKNDK